MLLVGVAGLSIPVCHSVVERINAASERDWIASAVASKSYLSVRSARFVSKSTDGSADPYHVTLEVVGYPGGESGDQQIVIICRDRSFLQDVSRMLEEAATIGNGASSTFTGPHRVVILRLYDAGAQVVDRGTPWWVRAFMLKETYRSREQYRQTIESGR
jgi:hypothetical protein